MHSRFIVLWGTNTIVTNLHFWPLVREAQRRGAKVVVVDPIRTRTAEAADWHLQIKPASDAALALAMMHVIIRDGLVDHDYVSQHAVGYDALAERARQYAPERVADTVGLPAEDIERFAREYATTQPSLLRPLIGIEHHRNGAMQFRTLACLAGAERRVEASRRRARALDARAAVRRARHGSRDDAGGVHARRPRAEHARPRQRSVQPRAAAAGPVRSSSTAPTRWCRCRTSSRIREGLLRDDLFTVVHELFVTETARYADYVLPATSQIEHLDLSPAWGHLYLALNRPAIAPRGESVSNTELFRRLAAALGRTEPWLFESDESMLRGGAGERASVARGHHLRAAVGRGLRPPELSRGLAAVRERRLPDAVSGKAELYSEPLREAGHDPLPCGRRDSRPATACS